MATRADIVARARTYLGVPYHHQGRSEFGMDCVGLIIAVARDLGFDEVAAADRSDYRTGENPTLRPTLDRVFQAIPVPSARPGDVLLMTLLRIPQHVGIMTPTGIIHGHMGVKCIVEHPMGPTWNRRVVAAYTFKGI